MLGASQPYQSGEGGPLAHPNSWESSLVTLLCAEQLDQILQTQAALGNAMPRWHQAIQAGAHYASPIKCSENRHCARRG